LTLSASAMMRPFMTSLRSKHAWRSLVAAG